MAARHRHPTRHPAVLSPVLPAVLRVALPGVVLVGMLAGCAVEVAEPGAAADRVAPTSERRTGTTTEPRGESRRTPGPAPAPQPEPTAPLPRPEPVRSFLSVPALGLTEFPVVRYVGSPDDAPGTAIQDAGPMASPRGPDGGVGPGEVGNFIVTGHRTSHTMPFADLPSLRAGDRVVVRSGPTELVYEITRTRWTSFRSERSLAAQSAPVPGRPRQEATRAMITLSTCATPEDHANGNYWSDAFGNPEHRIDKIGVLVDQRPAG